MRAYVGIKFHADDSNRATIEALADVLPSCGVETLCVRRDLEQWATLIDLTEKGVGPRHRSGLLVCAEDPDHHGCAGRRRDLRDVTRYFAGRVSLREPERFARVLFAVAPREDSQGQTRLHAAPGS